MRLSSHARPCVRQRDRRSRVACAHAPSVPACLHAASGPAAAKWDDTSAQLAETQAKLVSALQAEMRGLRSGLASIPPEVMKDLVESDRLCENKLRSVSAGAVRHCSC